MTDAAPSISAQIRALAAAGHSRAEIARLVDRSYQQVRQVLVADEARARRGQAPIPAHAPGMSEHGATYRHDAPTLIGDFVRIPVAADGTAVLPAEAVRRLTGGAGHLLLGRFAGETLWLLGPAAALEAAREGLPAWRPGEPMWSDELIADRRAEARREGEGG